MVVPMVLTHGDRVWTAPTDIRELMEGIDSLAAPLVGLLPQLTYVVADLRTTSNKELIDRDMTAASRLFLLALRNGKNPAEHAMFDQWKPLLDELGGDDDGLQIRQLLVTYLSLVAPDMDGDKMMHLAQTADLTPDWVKKSFAWQQLQKWLAQGLAQGREEGRQEGREEATRDALLLMLNARFGRPSRQVVAKVKRASLSELTAWTLRFATAPDLASVFVGTGSHDATPWMPSGWMPHVNACRCLSDSQTSGHPVLCPCATMAALRTPQTTLAHQPHRCLTTAPVGTRTVVLGLCYTEVPWVVSPSAPS